ncbi:MAG: HypC/HybG/HupF family hydrogenase formation chaperone [Rhodocyclaceae bacterium]
MCLSIPMQVVAWEGEDGDFAVVERAQGSADQALVRRERVNMMLIGPQQPGTWVLTSLGLAREVIDDAERALIEDALSALSAALDGNYDPTWHFTDLGTRSDE